jgi:hypothetical protein
MFAVIGLTPVASSAGKEISVPPPAIALTAPAVSPGRGEQGRVRRRHAPRDGRRCRAGSAGMGGRLRGEDPAVRLRVGRPSVLISRTVSSGPRPTSAPWPGGRWPREPGQARGPDSPDSTPAAARSRTRSWRPRRRRQEDVDAGLEQGQGQREGSPQLRPGHDRAVGPGTSVRCRAYGLQDARRVGGLHPDQQRPGPVAGAVVQHGGARSEPTPICTATVVGCGSPAAAICSSTSQKIVE